jgi:heme oxygenase
MQTAPSVVRSISSLKRLSIASSGSTNICLALKRATAEQRLQLEQQLHLAHRITTLGDYRELLGKYYGVYAPLEPVLWRALVSLKEDLQLSRRRQAARLSSDMVACGFSDADIVALPRWQAIAPFPTIAQALGRLYVLESAPLGGQMMARQFRKRFSLKKDAGVSFLNGCGADTTERWRELRSVLAARLTAPSQRDHAVAAAIDMYEILQRWIAAQEE